MGASEYRVQYYILFRVRLQDIYDHLSHYVIYMIFAAAVALIIISFIGVYDIKSEDSHQDYHFIVGQMLKYFLGNKPFLMFMLVYILFQGLTSIIFTIVSIKIILEIVEERYVNSAYGISSTLAKGL